MNDLIALLTGLPPETVQAAVGGYLLRLLGALTSITMVSLCAVIGARVTGMNMRKAGDKLESNPMAYALYTVGHFIGCAVIIASAMG